MDLRPTRTRLLICSTTEKYKAEVKGATLVPSCTLLPLAGLPTRKFHPQFSKINTTSFIFGLGLLQPTPYVILRVSSLSRPIKLFSFFQRFAIVATLSAYWIILHRSVYCLDHMG